MSIKFPLGRITITRAALLDLADAGIPPSRLLERHQSGDWGDLCDDDKEANERDLKSGDRLLSAYNLPNNEKVYVITEWDRSYTTILLACEY